MGPFETHLDLMFYEIPFAACIFYLLPVFKLWSLENNSDTFKLIEVEWRMYASVNKAIIGSDNVLSPVRRWAIVWNNTELSLSDPGGQIWNQNSR